MKEYLYVQDRNSVQEAEMGKRISQIELYKQTHEFD